MVYIWTVPRDYPLSMVGEHHPIGSADYLDYREARRLPDDYRAVDFIKFEQPIEKVLRYDNLESSISPPIVSPRLREAIEKLAPADVQFLPVRIVARDGQSDDYSIVNALKKVDAVDLGVSEPQFLADGISVIGWRKLVHRPDGMGDAGIGRDINYMGHLLVSERVKTELDLGGFKFRGLGLRVSTDIPW